MRIIADLHGGNLDNIEAKAEFREIKDKVVFEVRVVRGGCPVGGTVLRRRGRRARTRRPCVWRKGRVAFGRSDAYALAGEASGLHPTDACFGGVRRRPARISQILQYLQASLKACRLPWKSCSIC